MPHDGRAIARSTLWNLVGQTLPAAVAVIAIPVLVKGLGTDRLGILMLSWSLIGYFSLFDFGLGRALTQVVSERIGRGRHDEVAEIIWTATCLMTLLGVAATAIVALSSGVLVARILKVPLNLQGETLQAFLVLAAGIPFVTAHAGLRGVLEAVLRFDLTNAVRIPLGILTFVGPMSVLPFSHSLVPVMVVLVLARVGACIAQLILCIRTIPGLRQVRPPRFRTVVPLLRFGSWMTVSNVISPLMVSFDRFLIGALASMSAVAYYSTPYEAVTKLLLVPAALVGVLFPAFSRSFVEDRARSKRLFRRGVKALGLALFPLCLIAAAFAREGLTVWLGRTFADKSTLVLQLLAIGVFVNGAANVPFAFIQGIGRPDVTAKLHLLELPLYLTCLWWLVHMWGIVGAAAAWLARVTLDSLALFLITHRSLKVMDAATACLLVGLPIALLAIGIGTDSLPLMPKVLVVAATLAGFTALAWSWIRGGEDRVLLDGLRVLRVWSPG
jgi:O-antigen/teichoic acid export membrane protein